MNAITRRFVRPILFVVLAMGLAACHFHGGHWGHGGHGGHGGHWGGWGHFCAPIFVPVGCR